MMHNLENSPSAAAGLYAKHYAILRSMAERLRAGGPVDIDTLLEDSRRAMESYEICRDRLDAIRAELNAQTARGRLNHGFSPGAEESSV
jgi:hypothetical protein